MSDAPRSPHPWSLPTIFFIAGTLGITLGVIGKGQYDAIAAALLASGPSYLAIVLLKDHWQEPKS